MSGITRDQRHTRQHRCPVCGGADSDPRGQGKRCSGFTSADGAWCHCSREEHAGAIGANGAGLYAHKMQGACNCGDEHRAAPPRNTTPATRSRIVATYDYTDERGRLLFQVVRKEPKAFLQRKPDGDGGWIWKLGKMQRVPYRLHEFAKADAKRTVFIVEGEKDANALALRGQLATCNPGGAGKWSAVDAVARKVLADRPVCIVADADGPGRQHAQHVAQALADVASDVRVIEMPDEHKDVAAYLEAGGTVDEIMAMFFAGPEWKPESAPAPASWVQSWEAKLLRTQKGLPRKAVTNVVVPLMHDPAWAEVLRFNALANNVEKLKAPPWIDEEGEAGEWTEGDDTRLVIWLEHRLRGLTFTAAMVRAAVENVARRDSYHPIREQLATLKWDGNVRLGTWLRDYLGATEQPAEYLAAVGTWWPVSAVARVMQPGCQADHSLVLEGAQGKGKSTAVRILGGEKHSSTLTSTLGDKDSYQVLRGKWIVEIAELAGMRRSDVERVKAYISAPKDTYRPSYARCTADFPRQCVFICTTNAASYLADHTGARRFWPVRTGHINLKGLAAVRDQLWAEAVARYESNERWWPIAEDGAMLKDQQEERAEVDPWEGVIAEWLAGRVGAVTMREILGHAINKDPGQWTRHDETRAGAIMHQLGWNRRRARRNGARVYLYEPPADQAQPPLPGVPTDGEGVPTEGWSDHLVSLPSLPESPILTDL